MATSCPQCGHPLKVAPKHIAPGDVRTIEATGKGWKLISAFGWLGTVVGMTLLLAMIITPDDATDINEVLSLAGAACLLLGIPTYVVGKFGTWWFHG